MTGKGPSLGVEEWRRVLTRLAEALPPTTQRRVMVIGGVAMALGYGSRRTTTDVDVIMEPDVAAEILPIADSLAPAVGLLPGWMNQKASERPGFISPPREGAERRVVFESSMLVLEVPPTEHLLGMKLAAFRDDTDIEDATTLLKALGPRFSDPEGVWDVVGGFVPERERDKARESLHTLWEHLHEPA